LDEPKAALKVPSMVATMVRPWDMKTADGTA
jgi:hypothetical protein